MAVTYLQRAAAADSPSGAEWTDPNLVRSLLGSHEARISLTISNKLGLTLYSINNEHAVGTCSGPLIFRLVNFMDFSSLVCSLGCLLVLTEDILLGFVPMSAPFKSLPF